MKSQPRLYKIRRLLILQLVIMILLAVVGKLAYSTTACMSVLMGGLSYVLPNLYFALKVFQNTGARAARKIVNSFYQGEALKIVISVALFAFFFKNYRVLPFPFFMTYILMQMTMWLAPWVVDNK